MLPSSLFTLLDEFWPCLLDFLVDFLSLYEDPKEAHLCLKNILKRIQEKLYLYNLYKTNKGKKS